MTITMWISVAAMVGAMVGMVVSVRKMNEVPQNRRRGVRGRFLRHDGARALELRGWLS